MDDPMLSPPPSHRAEGFHGQRLCVVPRPQVEAALTAPATRRLTVTDAGFFPAAGGHRRLRLRGAEEAIVILCVGGSGTVRVEEAHYVLTRGACAVIPAHASHEYSASLVDPWTIWWVHVRGSDVGDLTGPLLATARPVTRLRSLERSIALFDELVSTLERRLSPFAILAASGLAWQLLTRIAVDSARPADGSPLERAMRFLEDRVDSQVPVSELARLVGVSVPHLNALFRTATGGGPATYHTWLKMARARALLDTTDASVAEVATAAGYADPLYFSRQFRKIHGMSPSAYRAHDKG